MSSKGFRERILEIYEDGAALASSTTQTSLLPASAKEATLGAGRLRIAAAIAFEFSGRMSTVVTTPGTLSLALRLGTVDVFASGGIPLNVTAQTTVHWSLKGEIIVRAVGLTTVTTFFPKGCEFKSRAVVGSSAAGSGGVGVELLPYNTAPAVGSGLDFSVSQLVDFLATWSVSNASNSITLHAGHVDVYTQ
jgi:hypothetical protein